MDEKEEIEGKEEIEVTEPTVGELLTKAREKLNKSLLDVESETKIRGKYVEALENNQFEVIPGEVYVKGFLLTYSSYLGLDSRHLLEEYKKTYQSPPIRREPKTSPLTQPVTRSGKLNYRFVYLTLVAIAIGAVAFLVWLNFAVK